MGLITNVVNQKGGVGKTTTVASLGSALAKRGLRTLLIDLDPDAYLSKWFSYRLAAGEPSSFDLFVGEGSPIELVRPVKLPGGDQALGNLFIIPSSPDLQGLDICDRDRASVDSDLLAELFLRHAERVEPRVNSAFHGHGQGPGAPGG